MVCLLAPCWWPLIPNLPLHPIYSQINVYEALSAYLSLCLSDFRALLVSPLPGWGTWCSEKPSHQPGVDQLRNPGFFVTCAHLLGLPRWYSGKEFACQCRRCRRCGFEPWIRKICRRKWQPTPVFLPGKFRGQRSLVGYSPWGCQESDRAEDTCLWIKSHVIFWLLFLLKFYLFIYFWLYWVLAAVCGLL